MLTLHSFLRSVVLFVKSLTVKVTKQMYRSSSVVMAGMMVVAIIAFSANGFGGGGRNALAAPMTEESDAIDMAEEENEGSGLVTEAKVQFGHLNTDSEGQHLAGALLEADVREKQRKQAAAQTQIETLQKQILKERQEEEARKKAEEAGKTYTVSNLGNISFKWPCPSSSRITSQFGGRSSPTEGASTDHKGVDIGASTGGFTDCMLQNGARKVYSIDVGYGQLAWKLRTDARVVNLERTNVRYLTAEQVPEPVDFFSVDVSFISLCLVLPVARQFMADGAQAVCLIKPQFEAGRGKVGKKGVVREPSIHVEVVDKIVQFVLEHGYSVEGLTYSPVKGPEGNIEYLVFLSKAEQPHCVPLDIPALVSESHTVLNGGESH